jgi:uncharacterized membrane protein YfcA
MLSLPIAAGFAAAIVSTSFISGIFGMAGGMILLGILLAFMPLAPAMVLHGLVQMASSGWRPGNGERMPTGGSSLIMPPARPS